MAVTGTCEHKAAKSDKRPLADLWLSMMSACGDEEGQLAHLFFDEDWNEKGLPCDSFDDDNEFDLFF